MALRVTRRERVVVSRTLHPEYRQVLQTFVRNQRVQVVEVPYALSGGVDMTQLESAVDSHTAAVVVQSPNFFGVLERVPEIAQTARRYGALVIVVVTEPLSLALVRPPVDADIVCGEAQSFGVPVSYGGPYAGFLTTREKYLRQMPGRLIGQTVDTEGRRGFVLTLATREQHIRREKATSNICTNQSLCALAVTIYLCLLGKSGLRLLAEQNLAKAHYLGSKLKLRFTGRYFNEFVTCAPEEKNKALLKKKIIGGLPLGRFYPELADCQLLCATEMTRRADMDTVAEVLA